MYLLKLHKHRHGNSIYFTRDNMVCFPKSGHIYACMRIAVFLKAVAIDTNLLVALRVTDLLLTPI